MSDSEKIDEIVVGIDKLVDLLEDIHKQITIMPKNNEEPEDSFNPEALLDVLDDLDTEKHHLIPTVHHNTTASRVTKLAALNQREDNASQFESRYAIPRHRSPPVSIGIKVEKKDPGKRIPKAIDLTPMQEATLEALLVQCLRKGHAVSRITALNWLTVSDWKIVATIKRVAAFNAGERRQLHVKLWVIFEGVSPGWISDTKLLPSDIEHVVDCHPFVDNDLAIGLIGICSGSAALAVQFLSEAIVVIHQHWADLQFDVYSDDTVKVEAARFAEVVWKALKDNPDI